MSKLLPLLKLAKIVAQNKKKGKRVVFTNGCFDLIHPGHIKILKEAKAKGDVLIVGLNTDSSIKKIKGPTRPILNQKARVSILEHIDLIDYIITFSEPTPYNLIKTLKPDVLVKGGDWSKNDIVGNDLVNSVFQIKLKKGFSTTGLIKNIKKTC